MIIEGVAIGVMLVMKLFPKTDAARLMHFHFVEKPAALTRRHLLFAGLMIGFIFTGNQFVLLAGIDFTMVIAWDMALGFDVLIAAWTAATMGRLGAMRDYLRARWRGPKRTRARSRSVRSRVRTIRRAADNDDEPGLERRAA